MMTAPAPAPASASASAPAALARGLGRVLNRSEAWLDSKGRGAWIAAMVLGFIAFWPVGLALVFYMTFTNRWRKSMFGQSYKSQYDQSCRSQGHCGPRRAGRSTGNSAFDAYRAETLRRLEEEQTAFEMFLERLRAAKDKTEFDNFMDDRARSARPTEGLDPTAPMGETGGGSAPGQVPQSY